MPRTAATAAIVIAIASLPVGAASAPAAADSTPHITNETLIFQNPSSQRFTLRNLPSGDSSWSVRHAGKQVESGTVTATDGSATASVPKLGRGYYTFTATSSTGTTTAAFLVIGDSPASTTTKYGVGVHSAHAEPGWTWDPARVFPLARKIGFNAIRDDTFWSRFPSEGTAETPATVTAALKLAADHDLEPLMIADYGLEKYAPPTAIPPADDTTYAPPDETKGYTAYAKFVDNFLTRNPSVKHLEVWNEFNGGLNTCSDVADPCKSGSAYAALLKAVHDRVDNKHPDVKLIAGGQSGYSAVWWQQFADAGGAQYADAYSYHPYGRTAQEHHANHQDLLNRLPDKPVHITEVGWSTTDTGTRPGNSAQVKTQRQQADRLAIDYIVPMTYGSAQMAGTYWYHLVGGSTDPTDVEGNFHLFQAPNPQIKAYQPRPAAYAFYYFRSLFGDTRGQGKTSLKDPSGAAQPAEITWSSDKKTAAVYRTDVGKVVDPDPVSVKVEVPADSTSTVTDAMGHTVLTAGKRSSITLDLAASPHYIRLS